MVGGSIINWVTPFEPGCFFVYILVDTIDEPVDLVILRTPEISTSLLKDVSLLTDSLFINDKSDNVPNSPVISTW